MTKKHNTLPGSYNLSRFLAASFLRQWQEALGDGASLTDLFRYQSVRQVWNEYLPLTGKCVSTINGPFDPEPLIPPSRWVSEYNRYGYLGTVYDHAIGLLLTGQCSLLLIRQKILPLRLRLLFDPIEDLLHTEMAAVRTGKKREDQLDFFRSIALLTDLRATAHGYKCTLPLSLSRQVKTEGELRGMLHDLFGSHRRTSLRAVRIFDPIRLRWCCSRQE